MTAISNVILVHGAWADGSGWAKMIPLLAAKELAVTAVQLPLTSFDADVAALGGTLSEAAWRSRPTFHLVGDQDHAIPPAEQERMATRMNATAAHVNSSHVPMLAQPEAVADFVLKAVG